MAVAASILADHLRKRGALTTTQARKIFTGFGKFNFLFNIHKVLIFFHKYI